MALRLQLLQALLLCGLRARLIQLPPGVLPFLLLQLSQLPPIRSAQAPLRLQPLQPLLLRGLCVRLRRVVLPHADPLITLQLLDLTTLAATDPAARLQLLQALLLRAVRG